MCVEDDELVERAWAGDGAALASLLDRYRARIGRVCRSYVGDTDGEDLVQATLLTAFERLPQLRDKQRFAAWLAAIARSTCLMWLRRRRIDAAMVEAACRALAQVSTDAVWERRHLRDAINGALAQLPSAERAAVALFYVDGYSHQEMSQRLAVSVTAVKGRLYRARQRLRPLLAAHGIAPACAPPPPSSAKEVRTMTEDATRTDRHTQHSAQWWQKELRVTDHATRTRILISDDSPIVVRLLTINLLHAGYDALGTTWPRQTLALARSWQPALVITDLRKGDRPEDLEEGFRIIQELKADEQTRHIPVLVISADAADQANAERAIACGADRLIAKPFDPLAMLATVGEMAGAR